MSKQLRYKQPPAIHTCTLCQYDGVSERHTSYTVPIKIAHEQTDMRNSNGMLVAGEIINPIEIEGLDFGDMSHFNLVASYHKNKQENLPPTMIFCGDTQSLLYAPNQESKSWVVHKGFKAQSYALYNQDDTNYIILPGIEEDLVSFDGAELVSHPIGHTFHHLTSHKMRLFGCKARDNKLYFSDDFQPYNWNAALYEGGYLSLPAENGEIISLISFGDWLVVAQERGLSKLSAYIDQTDFVLKYINIENDIIPGSVVDCKDRVVYCSSSGIGIFDGYENKIYFRELAEKLQGKQISGSYADGKCYFSLLDKQNGGLDTKILVIDLVSMNYYFMSNGGGNALAMVRSRGKKYIINYFTDSDLAESRGNGLYYIADRALPDSMVWKSGKVDFGVYGADKLVRAIVFGGKSKLRFKIVCDGTSYWYDIHQKRRLNINLKGRVFEFELRPFGRDICIPPPRIDYQVLEYYE